MNPGGGSSPTTDRELEAAPGPLAGPAVSDGAGWRPFPTLVRGLLRYLGVALAGVVLMLAGLTWDAVVHARDAEAAHVEETLFSLGNPAHVVLLAGGALAVAGLTAATVRGLALSGGRLLSSPRAATALVTGVLVLVAGTAGALRWASLAGDLPVATGPLAPAAGPDAHGIGIVNSHEDGECRPTLKQRRAAAKLVADTEAATAKYRNFAAAEADGFVGPSNPTLTEHYAKAVNTQDGKVLDPNRPEALMYTPTASGMVLVGVMYLMNVPGEFGPEPGGCLTRWHVHANVCFSVATFAPVSQLKEGETCPPGEFRYIPPPALHVWFLDVPGGRFAPEVDAAYLAKAVGGA
ncbi:MAG: hypothetical protein ACLGI2_00895 [Acidimicrobiia bacterium]